ncbi:tetratricopeptide repeat-containing hybrid sensor histidine kinase/response regulator [Flavobacterium ajazii]|uniref:tetratricopeptide repeat-containing hybrid sensor histidine kinase/response regulator n=1 Tax=Flavobacterium ajazii TaxID=2692318 RepID=UPI0013D77624|nr:ATP-binding protein [Flavobacterium ajazii]
MKYLFIFISFYYTSLYSQTKTDIDSISYYNKAINVSLKNKQYDKAVLFTERSINYCQNHHLTENQANQTFKLGKIHYNQFNYDEALKQLHKSITLFNKLPLSATKALALYYIGIVNTEKKNYETAEAYYKKADAVFNKLNLNDSQNLNLQKAIELKSHKDYILASKILKKIIQLPDNNNFSTLRSDAYYQLGLIAVQQKNDSAIVYFNKALKLYQKNQNLKQKSKIILALSQYHKNKKDFELAFSYLDEYQQIENYIVKLKNAKFVFDEFKKTKKNELLNDEFKRKSEETAQVKTYRYSKLISILAIALISILSLLSLALYKNNIIRTQNNLLLKEKNKELVIAKNKAEEATKARSEFLSTVSHELRTPLNAINGIAHILIEDDPKESQLKYLDSLQFSGNYLTTFINEILEINKIESTKIEIEKITFDLKTLLVNIQNSLKELAAVNNNHFKLEVDDAIPDNLIGDKTKLSQIILNLINNALKFTQNGEVSVIAKLDNLENENATVYFEITDTGIGIPKDKQKKVFESFSQGSVEVNRKYGGTGLGLTIVKKLTELLGGKIKLQSEVGKGSSFSLKLSFGISDKPSTDIPETKIYNDYQLRNKLILLIEDNKINQMITRKMLEKKSMNCEILDTGEEAIELIKTKQFDMILMDVHLPGINGTIATQQIREFDKTTPIIALTAISLDENRDQLLSFGMNDVITKPFVPDEFYSTIAKFFK